MHFRRKVLRGEGELHRQIHIDVVRRVDPGEKIPVFPEPSISHKCTQERACKIAAVDGDEVQSVFITPQQIDISGIRIAEVVLRNTKTSLTDEILSADLMEVFSVLRTNRFENSSHANPTRLFLIVCGPDSSC